RASHRDRGAVCDDAQGGGDPERYRARSAAGTDAVVHAAEAGAALRTLQQVPRAARRVQGSRSRGSDTVSREAAALGSLETDRAVARVETQRAELARDADAAVAGADVEIAINVLERDRPVAGLDGERAADVHAPDAAVAGAQVEGAAHVIDPHGAVAAARRDV